MASFTDTLRDYAESVTQNMDGLTAMIVRGIDGLGGISSKIAGAGAEGVFSLASLIPVFGDASAETNIAPSMSTGMEMTTGEEKFGNFLGQSPEPVVSIAESMSLGQDAYNALPESVKNMVGSIKDQMYIPADTASSLAFSTPPNISVSAKIAAPAAGMNA